MPEPDEPPTSSSLSIEDLLQAASMLLAKDAQWRAVHALHREIGHVLGVECAGPEGYGSRQEAEQAQRRLLQEFQSRREPRGSWLQELRNRLPLYASWVIVLLVGGGLSLNYAWGVLARMRWQAENPEGKWISRYYSNTRFEGSPIVRYDVGPNHSWGRGAPAKAMVRDRWSAQWDTCIVVTSDVTLKLRLSSDDTSKLVLDDATLIEIRRRPGQKSAKVLLQRGVRHLRIDFRETQGKATLNLAGLNFAGTRSFRFERPTLDGDHVHCEGSSAPDPEPVRDAEEEP